MTATKAFISYSWSSSEHKDWVLHLATDLRVQGVDAILDQWHLKEGHDANAFMEKMVSDETISKVIIVSDRAYAEKSNSRRGGAGTEAQIISQELYQKADQDKFVVVVREKNERGEAYIPTYAKARIYIDFSNDGEYVEKLEQLIRWIMGKPLREAPPLGQPPAYLTDIETAPALSTGPAQRRAYDALIGIKPHAYLVTKEYLDLFIAELEKFRLEPNFDPAADDFLSNFASFLPCRDECLRVIRAIARHPQDDRFGDLLHSFFEGFLGYTEAPEGVGSYRNMDYDNFKFFAEELFLHCCNMLFFEARADLFNVLVERPYYFQRKLLYGHDPLVPFTEFQSYMESLTHRNDRLKLGRTSLMAEMFKERTETSGTPFSQLMQTDFLLFLRCDLAGDKIHRWWPMTLVYLDFASRAFEMFERSRSEQHFNRVRPFLGNATKEDLETLLARYETPNDLDPPRFNYRFGVSPKALVGIDKLCTRP